jgi:hypothetical protein
VSRWVRILAFSVALVFVILALYLIHPILGGHRLPIGPDGPVYVWWTRYADAQGLDVLPGRLGVPTVALLLGALFGTDPIQSVTLLGPMLAAAAGLAAAAVTEMLLGPNPIRSAAAAVLTAAWAGHLAAGYLGTLAVAATFLCAIGALGFGERSWRGVILGGALTAAAALSHRPFLIVPLAIIGGALIVLAPEALRRRRRGTALLDTGVGRVTVAAIGGVAAGIGLDLVGGPDPSLRLVATSQDAFLRDHGLGDLLRREFRLRLAADARRSAISIVAGSALGVTAIARGAWSKASESRYLLAVLGSWAALSIVGIAFLAVTGGPANRLVTFAFFIPLAAAVGFEFLFRRGGPGSVLAVVAGLSIVAASMFGWYRQEPFIERMEVQVVTSLAGRIGQLPPGTPLVFVVDTEKKAPAFHVTRFANVIRSALPADRIADVRMAVGRAQDYLSGRPTITGNREHDRLSTSYLAESEPGASAVFVLEAFNPSGYAAASRLGTSIAPGVVALRGGVPVPGQDGAGSPSPPSEREEPGLGPGALAGLAMGALALLALVGGGWARWGLPGASRLGVAAASVSAGLASLSLGAAAGQIVGISPGDPGGIAVAVIVAAGGYLAAARAPRRPD